MSMRSKLGGLVPAVMVIGALFVGSCTTAPASPVPSTTSTASTKPYGSLTVATPFVDGTIVAARGIVLSLGTTYQAIGAPAFDSLVELTPDGQLRPGLAERWEIAPDGRTHTFYIRKGVKFQDGSDLTAADVKFTIEGMIAPQSTYSFASVWRGAADKVVLKDDYTVALQMKQPQFELLVGLDNFGGSGAVLPKRYIEEKGFDYFARNPVGSGPWKVMSSVANTRVELEAVESHWRAVPRFKNVTLLNVREEATKVAMLKTGELDIADIGPDSVSALKAAGLRILQHYGASQYGAYIFHDVDHPDKWAFGDVRVRKALSLAIDRKELADKVFGGYAQPSALWAVPTTASFFDPNVLKVDPYDLEGAKKLLAEAGYPNGFKAAILETGGGSILSTLNLAMAGYWRRAGVDAEIKSMDRPAATAMFMPKQVPEVWNTVYSAIGGGGFFQFEKMATTYHYTKSNTKTTRNSRRDELIDKVPQTLDPVEKKKLALEAAVLAKSEYGVLGILDVDTLFAIGSKIGEVKLIKGMGGMGASLETITHSK